MAREQTLDIHNYEHKYQNAERLVSKSDLSAKNKELILGYRDVCLRQGLCGRVRLIRVLGTLTLFGRIVQKDFDTLTRADIEGIVSSLLRANPPYSPETLGTYKAILKRFMTWVLMPNEFPTKTVPASVAWLTCHVRAKDKRRLQRRDLLTPEEAARLLSVCDNPRDRALVSILWETGSRIAETGNLQLKHVVKHEHGYLLDLNGKTGVRNPLIVSSAPYLSAWLAYHPFPNDPEAPLWVHLHHNKQARHISYQNIRKLLITLFARAGINKRPNPHGLRHARTTYLLGSGLMNEGQCKAYLGWSSASKMLGTYAHLTTSDANNAILAENRLANPTPQQSPQAVRVCHVCGEPNPPTAGFCVRCSNVLDEKAAYREQDSATMLLHQLCDVLAKGGLMDEAARAVHDAGLGTTLARLANQGSPKRP